MRARYLLLLSGMVLGLASCQTSRSAFQARPFGQVATVLPDSATTTVLLHDSQGPQATRALMTQAEAAAYRQQ